jgi:hypothetical protein
MSDALHPASPLVRASAAGGFNVHQFVDFANADTLPDAGDPVPAHPFFAPMPEPLPAVLRSDRAPSGSLFAALQDFDADDGFFDDLHGSSSPRSLLASAWAAHHEWIVAGGIILVALSFALSRG